MAYFFIIAGVILVIASARNTQGCLFTLLQGDLVNTNTALASSPCAVGTINNTSGNFVWWFISIAAIGAVGYSEKLRPLSNAFLTLIIVVLFIDNRGFFTQFIAAINTIKGSAANPIGNASSPGISVAVDTVPDNQSSSNETTIVAGGTGSTGGTPTSSGSCPIGYVYLDSQCVPQDFGTGSDPTDPYNNPFGDLAVQASSTLTALTPLSALHMVA